MISWGVIVLLHCDWTSSFVYQMQAMGYFSNIKFHCRFHIRYNTIPALSFSIFKYYNIKHYNVQIWRFYILHQQHACRFFQPLITIMEAEIYVSLKQRYHEGILENCVLWKCNKKISFKARFWADSLLQVNPRTLVSHWGSSQHLVLPYYLQKR